MPIQRTNQRPARLPQTHRPILPTRRNRLPIRTKRHRPSPIVMPLQRPHQRPIQIPQPHQSIAISRCQQRLSRTKRQTRHARQRRLNRPHKVSIRPIKPNRMVQASTRQPFTVPTKPNVRNPRRMIQRTKHFPLRRPQIHSAIVTTRNNNLFITCLNAVHRRYPIAMSHQLIPFSNTPNRRIQTKRRLHLQKRIILNCRTHKLLSSSRSLRQRFQTLSRK